MMRKETREKLDKLASGDGRRSTPTTAPVQTTRFRALTDDDKLVEVASPHKPPPIPGQSVVLHVRRNILGWHNYSWIVGKSPALTAPPGAL